MPTEDDKRVVTLNRDTLIPFGAVMAFCMVVFGAYSYLESKFDTIKEQNRDMEDKFEKQYNQLERRFEKIEETNRNRWTRTHQRIWALLLTQNNPTLKVPEVKDND